MAEAIHELEQVSAIATVIAQGLRSGCSITTALAVALEDARGKVAESLARRIARLQLGESVAVAFAPDHRDCPALAELLDKLRLTSQLGTAVADQISDAVNTWQARADSQLVQRATKAESRMLVPLVFLILPVTVAFALYPSLQLINLEGI